jgi:hypothetical protein
LDGAFFPDSSASREAHQDLDGFTAQTCKIGLIASVSYAKIDRERLVVDDEPVRLGQASVE